MRLEFPELEDRIRGALFGLRTETHEARFKRLQSDIETQFGERFMREEFVADLIAAIRLRGKCAHGNVKVLSGEEFKQFYRATLAMEALCFLLTMRELPASPDRECRLRQHPMLYDYLLAY